MDLVKNVLERKAFSLIEKEKLDSDPLLDLFLPLNLISVIKSLLFWTRWVALMEKLRIYLLPSSCLKLLTCSLKRYFWSLNLSSISSMNSLRTSGIVTATEQWKSCKYLITVGSKLMATLKRDWSATLNSKFPGCVKLAVASWRILQKEIILEENEWIIHTFVSREQFGFAKRTSNN